MNKKIYLFWYKFPVGKGNFGDELSPYIIKKLSGITPTYVNVKYLDDNFLKIAKLLLKLFVNGHIEFFTLLKYIKYNFFKINILLSVGSIFQFIKIKNYTCWGTGIMSKNTFIQNGNFKAVRGNYSKKRLEEFGYLTQPQIGDPAILLPLVYTPVTKKIYKIGVIPHYIHFEELNDIIHQNIIVIDLLDSVEEIIDQINSCEITFSTSLHGIIVSHSYNIPSLWVNFKECNNMLSGDNVKFKDYFSSVNLPEYDTLSISKEILFEPDFVSNILSTNKEKLLPGTASLNTIRDNLIECAPFKIISHYRNY